MITNDLDNFLTPINATVCSSVFRNCLSNGGFTPAVRYPANLYTLVIASNAVIAMNSTTPLLFEFLGQQK